MNLDEHSIKVEQKLSLSNRTSGYITGVKEVISFDPKEIILDTQQGGLTIKGSDLHITKLAVDKGNVEITGCVDSMVYSNTNFSKNNSSLFQRLFK
ncbi:MAG: sporulation protein YabP [Lachnospiraceae bacterium]